MDQSTGTLPGNDEPIEVLTKEISGDGYCGINSVASVLFAGLGVVCTDDEDPLRVNLVGNAQFIADVKASLERLIRLEEYSTLPDPYSIQDYYSLKAYFQQPFFTEMQPKFEKQCVPLIFRIALLRTITSTRPALVGLQQSVDYAERLNQIAQGQTVPSLQSMSLDSMELQDLLLGVRESFLSALPVGSPERVAFSERFERLTGNYDEQEQVLAAMLSKIQAQEQNLEKLADMTSLERKLWLHETFFNTPFRASRASNPWVLSTMLTEARCTDTRGIAIATGSLYDVPFSEEEIDELGCLTPDLTNPVEELRTQDSLAHFADSVAQFDASASGDKVLPIAALDSAFWPGVDQLSVLIKSLFCKKAGQQSDLVIVADRAGYVNDILTANADTQVIIRNKGGGHFDLGLRWPPGSKGIEQQFAYNLRRPLSEPTQSRIPFLPAKTLPRGSERDPTQPHQTDPASSQSHAGSSSVFMMLATALASGIRFIIRALMRKKAGRSQSFSATSSSLSPPATLPAASAILASEPEPQFQKKLSKKQFQEKPSSKQFQEKPSSKQSKKQLPKRPGW